MSLVFREAGEEGEAAVFHFPVGFEDLVVGGDGLVDDEGAYEVFEAGAGGFVEKLGLATVKLLKLAAGDQVLVGMQLLRVEA